VNPTWKRRVTILTVALACAVVPPLLTRTAPGVFTGFRAQALGIGACWAAMALALNLLMGYAGQISLGHGAFVAAGAYTAGVFTARWYLPAGLSWIVAALIGAALALVVGLPALRLKGLYLAITTLAFSVAMEEFALKIPWLSRGSAGVPVKRPYFGSFGFTRNGDFLVLILLVVLVIYVIDTNVTRTKLGRAFAGIREDERVAQSFGVDVARYKLLAFALSGALAGVAGALYGELVGFVDSVTFSFQRFSLLLVVLVVIGGLGSRAGVMVAAAVYAVLPEFLHVFAGWDLIIGSLLLIYTVARHPGGMAAAWQEATHRRAHKLAIGRGNGGGDDDDEDASATIPQLPDLPRPAHASAPAIANGAAVLSVRDVTVRFGGLTAVDGASLDVAPNTIVGLIGPNGAGKSTLFNAVSGFVTPNAGSVLFHGRSITELAPHQRAQLGIGRTFQQAGLAANLSLVDNLLLAQHAAAGYDPASALAFLPQVARTEAELLERARATVTALGFDHLAGHKVRQLSGGQQRIVELACALVGAPDLLLLDEPSAGMAPAAVENLAVRLRDLRDTLGRTVLLIEHHIPLVLDVCDVVYVLDQGQVLASGKPDEVVRDPAVVAAYLGGDVPEPAGANARRARRTTKKAVPA
jgi:branched-chain amino acid transport system permease protein